MRRRPVDRNVALRQSAGKRAIDGECALPREHLVQHEAQRVDVGPRRRPATFQLLRCHVAGRARNLWSIAPPGGEIGETEISEVCPTLSVDQDVRRLEISMQDAAVVRRREARAELPCELQRLVRWQSADAPQQRREILTVDVLHREKVLTAGFADVVHPAHVGMGDLARETNFLMKSREPIGVMRDFVRQKLECDGLTELQIFRSIDFAHPAASEEPDDAVTLSEHRAGNELSAVERVG